MQNENINQSSEVSETKQTSTLQNPNINQSSSIESKLEILSQQIKELSAISAVKHADLTPEVVNVSEVTQNNTSDIQEASPEEVHKLMKEIYEEFENPYNFRDFESLLFKKKSTYNKQDTGDKNEFIRMCYLIQNSEFLQRIKATPKLEDLCKNYWTWRKEDIKRQIWESNRL